MRDLTYQLHKLMEAQGYYQKLEADRGHGPSVFWVDRAGNFVGTPPGTITRVRNNSAVNGLQVNLRLETGAWLSDTSGRDEEWALLEQREIIRRCRNGVTDKQDALFQQMVPLIKLVAEHDWEGVL